MGHVPKEKGMKNLNEFGRLGWHGGKLVLRVLAILVPVAVGALWSALQTILSVFGQEPGGQPDDWNFGYSVDEQIRQKVSVTGVPWPENVEHSAWQAHYGDHIDEKWRFD